MTGDWQCEAYTPETRKSGALCFIARPGERECGTREMCAAVMDVERRRIFQRVQERAAAGDPVAAFLASELTAAEDLLGGSSDGSDGSELGRQLGKTPAMTDIPVCLDCLLPDPPPDQSCDGGPCSGSIIPRDHFVGTDHPLACPSCGRLLAACVQRPCQARRGRGGGGG